MSVAGRRCKLLIQVRDKDGTNHVNETVLVKREVVNLDRVMYLIELPNGKTTFLFPNEVEFIEEDEE